MVCITERVLQPYTRERNLCRSPSLPRLHNVRLISQPINGASKYHKFARHGQDTLVSITVILSSESVAGLNLVESVDLLSGREPSFVLHHVWRSVIVVMSGISVTRIAMSVLHS